MDLCHVKYLTSDSPEKRAVGPESNVTGPASVLLHLSHLEQPHHARGGRHGSSSDQVKRAILTKVAPRFVLKPRGASGL